MAKWAGTTACIATVGLWVLSGWWCAYIDLLFESKWHTGLAAWRGGLGLSYGATFPGLPPSPPIRFIMKSTADIRAIGSSVPGMFPWFYFYHGQFPQGGDYSSVSVPMWVILPFLLAPTAYLWHRDRRRFAPGQCQRCEYDLAGLRAGAACPECGQTPPSAAAPIANSPV